MDILKIMNSGNLLQPADIAKLGNYLRTVREFKDLNRQQAASLAGVSLSWLQKLETGKHLNGVVSPLQLKNYCDSLGVTLEITYNLQ